MVKPFEHSNVDKVYALLSYLGTFPFFILPLFLIPLLMKRDHPWVHNHAKQGMLVYILVILVGWIPLIGWLIALIYIIFSIIAMVKILQGLPYWKMPILGNLAKKINI